MIFIYVYNIKIFIMLLDFLLYLYNFLLNKVYTPKKVHFVKNELIIINEKNDEENYIKPIKKTISTNNLIINNLNENNLIKKQIIYDKNKRPWGIGIWISLSKDVDEYGFYFVKKYNSTSI